MLSNSNALLRGCRVPGWLCRGRGGGNEGVPRGPRGGFLRTRVPFLTNFLSAQNRSKKKTQKIAPELQNELQKWSKRCQKAFQMASQDQPRKKTSKNLLFVPFLSPLDVQKPLKTNGFPWFFTFSRSRFRLRSGTRNP